MIPNDLMEKAKIEKSWEVRFNTLYGYDEPDGTWGIFWHPSADKKDMFEWIRSELDEARQDGLDEVLGVLKYRELRDCWDDVQKNVGYNNAVNEIRKIILKLKEHSETLKELE